jgi:hypothetical protein
VRNLAKFRDVGTWHVANVLETIGELVAFTETGKQDFPLHVPDRRLQFPIGDHGFFIECFA